MSRAFDMALESLTDEQRSHIRTLRRHVAYLMDLGATPADIEEFLQLIDERELLHALTRGNVLAAQEEEATQ
jgi:flagellar basal body P-ring protein FlgI